ncbi:hypothetical protein ABPG74_012073 [Tetrahymena malaccensis]
MINRGLNKIESLSPMNSPKQNSQQRFDLQKACKLKVENINRNLNSSLSPRHEQSNTNIFNNSSNNSKMQSPLNKFYVGNQFQSHQPTKAQHQIINNQKQCYNIQEKLNLSLQQKTLLQTSVDKDKQQQLIDKYSISKNKSINDSKSNLDGESDSEEEEEVSIWQENELKTNGVDTDQFIDSRGQQLDFYQIYRLRSALYQPTYVSRLDTIQEVQILSQHFNKEISIQQLEQQQIYLDKYYDIQKKAKLISQQQKKQHSNQNAKDFTQKCQTERIYRPMSSKQEQNNITSTQLKQQINQQLFCKQINQIQKYKDEIQQNSSNLPERMNKESQNKQIQKEIEKKDKDINQSQQQLQQQYKSKRRQKISIDQEQIEKLMKNKVIPIKQINLLHADDENAKINESFDNISSKSKTKLSLKDNQNSKCQNRDVHQKTLKLKSEESKQDFTQTAKSDVSSENNFSQYLKLEKTSSLDENSKNVKDHYDDEGKDEEYSIWDEKDLQSNGICTNQFIDSRGNQLQFYQIYRLRSALYQNSYVSRFDTFKQVLNISTHFNRKLSLNQLKKQQNYLDSFFKIQQRDYIAVSENKLANDKLGEYNKKNDFPLKSSIASSSNEKIKDKNNKQFKNTCQKAAQIQEKNIWQKINEYHNRRQSLKLLLNKGNIIQKIILQDQQLFQNDLKKHDDNLNQPDSQNQNFKEQLVNEKEKFQPKVKNELQKKNLEQKICDYQTRRQSLKLLLNKSNVIQKIILQDQQLYQNDLKKHYHNLNQPDSQNQNFKEQLVNEKEKFQPKVKHESQKNNIEKKIYDYYTRRQSLKLLLNNSNTIQETQIFQNNLKKHDANLNQDSQKQALKGQFWEEEEKLQQEIIIDKEEMNVKQEINDYYNRRSSQKQLQNKMNTIQKIVIQEQKFFQNDLNTNDDDTLNQFISQKDILNDNKIDQKEIQQPVGKEEKNQFLNQEKKKNIIQSTISFISKLKQKLFI